MSKIWHDKGEIEIAFPQAKFDQIIQDLNFKGQKITTPRSEKVFLRAIQEFLKGNLFLEELAEISMYLFSIMSPQDQRDTKLGDALYKCSELIFYVRAIPEDGSAGNFNWFLSDVLKYYRARIAQ